jgi:autotransporter-associated beta strand protein
MSFVQAYVADPAIASAAAAVNTALNAAVLDKYASDDVQAGTDGLAIYLPGPNEPLAFAYDTSLDFVADTHWTEFLSRLSAPTVTSVVPPSGPVAGGTSVTITGEGFITGATAVDFGSTAATNVVVDSDTQITATSPAEPAGVVHVTVTTPGGTSETSSADQFSYAAMTWKGLGDGNWADPTQWSGGPAAFPDATIDVTLNTARTITVDSAQSANSLDVSNSGDVTIAAGGTLAVVNGVTLGSGGTVSVLGGGTLATAGLDETDASAGVCLDGGTLQAGAPLVTSVPLTIDAGGATLDTAEFDVTLAANLIGGGGAGGLTKAGSGSLILCGAGSYSGATTVSDGVLVVENIAAIPGGSLLAIGPDGGVVLGTPGASEPLAAAQAPGAGPLQVAVAAAGQADAEAASLVVGGAGTASLIPGTIAGGRAQSESAEALTLGHRPEVGRSQRERGPNSPAAVDCALATQRVSGAVGGPSTPFVPQSVPANCRTCSFAGPGWPSRVLLAPPVQIGEARPRVAALRTAAFGQASDETLIRFAEARAGNAAARAGNQALAAGFFGLDLHTLDLLAGAVTERQ